jgi:subtilisin family serine protease
LAHAPQAIRYAVDIWKVDIIVMSFGFEEEQDSDIEEDSILKAIRHAYHSGISLFAAASNDGNNRPDHVCWPARALEVICVHSGTGTGQPSTFTPGPYDNQRIMVLGEWVKSAWPLRLRSPGNTKYMSGTSCATPIAAGIAAIVLDYARKKLPPERWKRLRRVDGMQRMFERMKDSRVEKYWWIRPWDFFQRNNTLEWIDNEIRKAIG